MSRASHTILTIFGTRPEVIKLGPVLREFACHSSIRSIVVSTGQHTDLVRPFVELFELKVDHDLQLMRPGQTPNELLARALTALDPVLATEHPDVVLVQGDTTTALAGALAAFHRGIRVGHVEAGLRSGDPLSPFPEEMNRRLISRLATFHFAATTRNHDTLLAEGIDPERVFLTGNPVVDALQMIVARQEVSPTLATVLQATEGLKRITLTTHRRESFGATITGNLAVLGDFVAEHEDAALLFPVHPNPNVRGPAFELLGNRGRIHLLAPLDYGDFLTVLSRSWLIVSDSGGVQEEAPTLGVPLLILRRNTERPEAIECGAAKLAGESPELLRELLEQEYRMRPCDWIPQPSVNPFGHGDSGQRIVECLRQALGEIMA